MNLSRLLFLLLALVPSIAHAAAEEWQQNEAVGVRLISGVDAVGTMPTIPLGLEVRLAEGWHTYWRSPGEAGLPPQLDWSASQNDEGNLKDAALLYPAPERLNALGMETAGYRDHVLFPVEATLLAAGKPLKVSVTLDILVCSTLCVPKHFSLNLTVPEGAAIPSAEAGLLETARARVPQDSPEAGFDIASVEPNADALKITITSQEPLKNPELFIENDKGITLAYPEYRLNTDKTHALFTLKLADRLPEGVSLALTPFTITLVDGDRAFARILPPAPAPHIHTAPPTQKLPFILLLAVLGGFILNLMPCVLPVLSLKVLSVVSHGGGLAATVRRSFLVTAAGIVFSFLVLAGTTLALKETGHVFGWGVQFQQPLFLVFLAVLLTFFAATLWDLFDIPLPRFLADRLDPLYHPKLAGDFATGALATILATPCSAPFLGTAVGFALVSDAPVIVAVFAALGFGMALPYLAIALWPRLATALPRPGAWMALLRRLLGGALALTAVWLLWVLMAQIAFGAWIAVCGSLTVLLGALYIQRHRIRKGREPKSFLSAILFIFVIIPFLIAGVAEAPPVKNKTTEAWQKFDEGLLARAIAEGKTVFVDVTADWCLTCKANKKFTLERQDVSARLFDTPNIIAMRANWTNPDPAIAAFLNEHGRYGIPFNAVFGPHAPQGIVLPELLTAQDVLESLDRARR